MGGSTLAVLVAAAFAAMAAAFVVEVVLSGMLASTVAAIRTGQVSDDAFMSTVAGVRNLDGYSRGVGSAVGIGAAFACTVFLANMLVAVDATVNGADSVFDVGSFATYSAYGLMAVFVLMFLTTLATNLRVTVATRRLAARSRQKDPTHAAEVLDTLGGIRLRFIAYAAVYAISVVPAVMLVG